jgi:hypothetical protein
MNRRYIRRSLGDDAVSAAASAAVAAAASVAPSGATVTKVATPARHRRKQHRPVAPSAADAATAASPSPASAPSGDAPVGKRTAKHGPKPSHPRRGSPPLAEKAPADKERTLAAQQPASGHGHLLLIGGAILGIGVLALLLARKGDEHETKPMTRTA